MSDGQEEPNDTQPVPPASAANRGKRRRKKKQQQQQQQQQQQHGKRSVSAPQLCAEDTPEWSGDTCVDFDPHETIVRGIFQIGKRSHDVILTPVRLTWTPIQPETPTAPSDSHKLEESVEMREVLGVKVKRRRSAGQQTGGTLLGLTLFYCKRKGLKLKQREVHLNNMSIDHCEVWFNHLREILSGFQDRPRSLKVFVNPASHRKEAPHIYRDLVAPLFQLAGIKTHLTVTERRGHALSILKESTLEEYDGVVCVGGDGSVAEVAQGLLLRAQAEAEAEAAAGGDPDPSSFTPVRAALPLGVIPAGSTDMVACSVHGIRHPATAAMHIILGHRQAVDVCSFSTLGRLLRFGFCAMLGFGGRTLALAERHRWMPPGQRREYAVIRTLAHLRPEDCELSFLPVNQVQSEALDPSKNESTKADQDAEKDEAWRTSHGLYLNISVMSIPCLCSMAPRGLAPNTRLDNGSMALITAGNTSRSEFVKHLKRYSSVTNQFSFSFVETHSVRAVKLRPHVQGGGGGGGWPDDISEDNRREEEEEVDSSKHTPILSSSEGAFPWNIDGDLLETPSEMLIRVHPRLLTLFGVDVEEAEEAPVSCSCI